MTSKARLVSKAFGKRGVLKNATADTVAAIGGGVTAVANEAALGSGSATDLKFATATKSLFLHDGTEWDRVQTGGNAAPFFNVSPGVLSLGSNDSSTVTVHAGDPEGFPITYRWDALKADSSQTIHYKEGGGTFPPGIIGVVHANDSSRVFRFQADSNGSGNKGSYTYRIIASDGANTAVATNTLDIAYTNDFHTKYKAAVEAAGGSCTVHTLNATDNANLHTYINSASVGEISNDRYDVLLLEPGSYTLTSENISYSWDPFYGKAFAIVGNTNNPAAVHVTQNGSSGRDYPIWGNELEPVGFRATKALANLTWKKASGSTTNYSAALRRNTGGMARNVLFDFNNQGVSMNYYNSEPATSTHRLSTYACTFANVGSRTASYSGQAAGFVNSRNHSAATTTWSAVTFNNNSGTGTLTADDTKYWTYTDNGATRGHLYGVSNSDFTINISGTADAFSDQAS